MVVIQVVIVYNNLTDNLVHKAPAYARSGKGSHHLLYVHNLTLFLHKRLFSGFEPAITIMFLVAKSQR